MPETWTVRRLTESPEDTGGTAHSYYDIPVFDAGARRIVGYRLPAMQRHPGPDDAVEVGLVATDGEGPSNWRQIGTSRAWSWQQGPLAQWVGGRRLIWSDREDTRIVSRLHDPDTGETATLPAPVYAVAPDGQTGLSLDLTRLDALRPGYGHPGGPPSGALSKAPRDGGVRSVNLSTGETRLLLSLERAVRFLDDRRDAADRFRRVSGWGFGRKPGLRGWLGGVHYWFNHVKIAPSGRRFTVKLRWRRIGGPWSDPQGVSLTCGLDGKDLRLLAEGTSHVIWMDDDRLYFWRRDGGLRLVGDTAPQGTDLGPLAAGLGADNVHIRHLDAEAKRFVLDTPYAETVSLLAWDRGAGAARTLATFTGHVPAKGPFRCDLHPCASADGRRVALTSPQSGRREIWLAEANR